MVISYSGCCDEQARPERCVCESTRFHRHGWYWRSVAGVKVFRFKCVLCKLVINLLPSCCVPHKHHPTGLIEEVFEAVLSRGHPACRLERGGSGAAGYQPALGLHRSTVGRWLKEFQGHSAELVLEGFRRLGLAAPGSEARVVYKAMKSGVKVPLGAGLFEVVQLHLAKVFPIIGLFRVIKFRP